MSVPNVMEEVEFKLPKSSPTADLSADAVRPHVTKNNCETYDNSLKQLAELAVRIEGRSEYPTILQTLCSHLSEGDGDKPSTKVKDYNSPVVIKYLACLFSNEAVVGAQPHRAKPIAHIFSPKIIQSIQNSVVDWDI